MIFVLIATVAFILVLRSLSRRNLARRQARRESPAEGLTLEQVQADLAALDQRLKDAVSQRLKIERANDALYKQLGNRSARNIPITR